jgi:hypothetical protein
MSKDTSPKRQRVDSISFSGEFFSGRGESPKRAKSSKKWRGGAVPSGRPICSVTLRVGSFDDEILPTRRVRLKSCKGAKRSKNRASGWPLTARSASEWILFGIRGEIHSLALRAGIRSLRDVGWGEGPKGAKSAKKWRVGAALSGRPICSLTL